MLELQYEPTSSARPVSVEYDGGVTRIVVAMRGIYAPVGRSVLAMGEAAIVLFPFFWVASLLYRWCLRLPKPPRAVFEIGVAQVKVDLRDPGSGGVTSFQWPREAIVEARANRYERGLWLNVMGHVKTTFLSDLPQATIQRFEAELAAALAAR
jgi:hypothetical protein